MVNGQWSVRENYEQINHKHSAQVSLSDELIFVFLLKLIMFDCLYLAGVDDFGSLTALLRFALSSPVVLDWGGVSCFSKASLASIVFDLLWFRLTTELLKFVCLLILFFEVHIPNVDIQLRFIVRDELLALCCFFVLSQVREDVQQQGHNCQETRKDESQ